MNGTPEDRPSDTAATDTAADTAAAPGFYEAYQAKLGEAVRALTDAARLPRPRLRRTDEGTWVEDPGAAPEQMDWAEFVTLAIAGAAANMGGVDAALAGRSGSWEAEGVRQLLYSTVGALRGARVSRHHVAGIGSVGDPHEAGVEVLAPVAARDLVAAVDLGLGLVVGGPGAGSVNEELVDVESDLQRVGVVCPQLGLVGGRGRAGATASTPRRQRTSARRSRTACGPARGGRRRRDHPRAEPGRSRQTPARNSRGRGPAAHANDGP